MRLGVMGLLPKDSAAVDPAALKRVREWGFTGVGASFNSDHRLLDDRRCQELRSMFADAGVNWLQYGAFSTPLIHREPDVMARYRQVREEQIRIAAKLGARSVCFGSGSLSPMTLPAEKAAMAIWMPDPRNWGDEAFDMVVTELKATAKLAETLGVYCALECQIWSVLSTAERTRAVVDAVGSPNVRVTVDPVNWITPANFFDNGRAIEEMFRSLGTCILDAHAKDINLEPNLNIHMPETYVGNGSLDFGAFLRCMEFLHPEAYVIIEHTPVELIPAARDNLLAVAGKLGIRFH